MHKQILHTTIKLTVVAVLSGAIAYFVGITDYILVGTIGILSVSLTKKDTITDNVKRYLDVLMGLGLSTIIFLLLGYNLFVLVGFLILFIFLSYTLKINIGLIPALVLAKHVYEFQNFTWPFLLEEIGIITISIGTALVLNLFYPEFYNTRMVNYIKQVDEMLKDHLFMLGLILKNDKQDLMHQKHFELLNKRMNQVINQAELGDKDKLFDQDHKYLAYLYMRRNQLNYINNMYASTLKIENHHPYEYIVSDYIINLVSDIGFDDKATEQLVVLNELKDNFRKEALPKTRSEFETRALLFHILEDLVEMLNIKLGFHKRYNKFNI